MVVYADVVFAVNFISVAALIFAYSIFTERKIKVLRMLCGACVAGVYAVAESVLELAYPLRIFVICLVAAAAFGIKSYAANTLRFIGFCAVIGIVFTVAISLMGYGTYIANGTVTVFANDIITVFLYALSYPALFAVRKIASRRTDKKNVSLTIEGHKIKTTLYYDSGNFLKHKGTDVAVISWERIKPLYPDRAYEDFILIAEERMIYNTVGTGGILPILTPERAEVNGFEVEIKIAVANRNFGEYDGVIGKMHR